MNYSYKDELTVSVARMPERHFTVFYFAIKRVFNSPIAKRTFGEILVGVPLAETALDRCGLDVPQDYPLRQKPSVLHPAVIAQIEAIVTKINVREIRVSHELSIRYQSTHLDAADFGMRLVEMVAFAIHRLATMFRIFHDPEKKSEYMEGMPTREELATLCPGRQLPVNLLRHQKYRQRIWDFPLGRDEIGYWAQSRIFGGLPFYDPDKLPDPRDPTSLKPQDRSIYLHPDRHGVPDEV
ncbi:hypothetical protein FSARC_5388 [Fusarium sarcochroum]|uniref:Uncharacterized protein n=1 Tax=Fusarium sarcochroum TaxID=1208366 RepID=A0A8H4TZK2_9HYPO|nr:hypothetical protein FSARC_5388 [Fusarium sarcochroum]